MPQSFQTMDFWRSSYRNGYRIPGWDTFKLDVQLSVGEVPGTGTSIDTGEFRRISIPNLRPSWYYSLYKPLHAMAKWHAEKHTPYYTVNEA